MIAIGVLAIVAHGGMYALKHIVRANEKGEARATFESPDKRFKAVLYSANGGGGISPFCYDSVYVVTSSAEASNDSQRVYLAGCHSFADHTNGPEVRWLSNNRLQIRFAANQGARGVDHLELKGFAEGGKVVMAYVVNERSF